MKKPEVIEIYADNGALSHYALVDPETGDKLWSEDPEECKAMGHPVKSVLSTHLSDEKVKAKIEEQEQYHLKGMLAQKGETVSSEFAAMCCANSFDDAIRWARKELQHNLDIKNNVVVLSFSNSEDAQKVFKKLSNRSGLEIREGSSLMSINFESVEDNCITFSKSKIQYVPIRL